MYDGHIVWELENHQMAILVLVQKNLGKLQRIGDTEARTGTLKRILIIQPTNKTVCPITSSFPKFPF